MRFDREDNDRRNDMREKIITQSIQLFEQKGFTETSIQDIVEPLSVTKGTFYYYFTSKEQLLMDIHSDYIDDLLNRQEQICQQKADSNEKLVEVIKLLIRDIETQGANARIYFREMRNLTDANAETIMRKREKFRQTIEDLIEGGIVEGQFRSDIHPKMISFAVLGVTNWSYQWFKPTGEISIEELATMYSDFVLHGVRAFKEEEG